MENKRLYGRICYLQRQMYRENSFLFSEYGITPIQLNVLIFVQINAKSGRSVCQRDIEKHVNLRPSSVSTLLATLEKNELIERTVAGGDARTKYVNITEKGKKLCIQNKLLMDKCDMLVESALTEEEREIFNNLLNKIIDKIYKPEKEVNN